MYSGNGMMTALLEPHLRKEASASQFDVAMAFLAMGGVYMITTPITGYVRLENLWGTCISMMETVNELLPHRSLTG